MPEKLRNTGIDIIGDVPWGTHFCQFYETKQDLIDILVPYFKAGLENNEYCMWVAAEPLTHKEAMQALRQSLPDLDKYLEKGQIEIIPHTEWYLKGGSFEANRVLNGWVDRLNGALSRGFDGLRLTGNTFFLEKSAWDSFADYEATVNDIIGNYKIVALCSYSLEKCNAVELIDVVRNHQFALIKREGKWEQIESDAYRKTTDALRETNKSLQSLLESISDGFFTLEEGLVVTYFNKTAEKLLGRRAEEIVGRNLFEAFPEAKGSVFEDNYSRALKERQPLSFESYFGVKPYENWYSIRAYPNEKGISVFFQITTEQKKAEQALRESEEKYRTLFNSMTEGFTLCRVVYDSAGKPYDFLVLDANPAAEIANGVRREDFVGKTWRELWPGAEQYWWEICDKVVLHGEQVRSQNYASLHDRWYDVHHFSPGKDLMATIFTDITERKKAEDVISERETELAAILSNVPILTLVVDAERRVLKVNTAATNFAARRAEEMLGMRAGEALGCLHATDDPLGCGFGPSCQTCEMRLYMLDTIENGKSHFQVECRRPFQREGKMEEVSFLLSTVLLDTQKKQLLVCIEDITGIKRAENEIEELNQALRQRAAELEASNKELEAFAYSVSHDLRAPLRSMAGFSEALLEDYGSQLDEQGKQYLTWIRESGELMGQLVDDLLQLSRMTRAEMHREAVDLSTLAKSVLAGLKQREPERRVECTIAPQLTCEGDSRLLGLVLENLIGNAWKFTGKTSSPRIEIGATERNGETVYFVRDNGAGFDMAYANKLFLPFQRLHKASEFPGTGIGLATVERLIRRHGGRIWPEAEVGKGATFYFTLR